MARRDSLAGFHEENGLWLTLQKAAGAAARRSRDRMLAARLGTRGMRLGKHPKLAGLAHMRIGENFSAGNGLWLDAITLFAGQTYEPLLTIGSDCNVSDSVHIACVHRVTIGEGLLCGSRVIISDHAHGVYSGEGQSDPRQRPVQRRLSTGGLVTIGRNVWLGDGVAVLAGAEIGDGAIIGANAVVTGKVAANTIAVGAPAREVKRWEESAGRWVALREAGRN